MKEKDRLARGTRRRRRGGDRGLRGPDDRLAEKTVCRSPARPTIAGGWSRRTPSRRCRRSSAARSSRSRRIRKPWLAAAIVPPKGAPNVRSIMTDDVGFGAPSTFGGVIPTPALDRIAKAGLRYTQFHSTALCSPTRAALITGRNHHSVGFGVISELSTGFPGYDSIIGRRFGDRSAASCRTTATPPPGSARTTTRRRSRPARPGHSTSGRSAWASSTSTASSAATPASGSRTCSATPRRSIPTSATRTGT